MGFATFPICPAAEPDERDHLPRNAYHTPRRIPLISSRTVSLRPLPSCCYSAFYRQPPRRSELVDTPLHTSRNMQTVEPLFQHPKMLSMRSGTLRNPKIALVSVLTAVSSGNRSINEPTSTRRPLPLLLKSRSSSTQPQGADEGFSQHRSTVKNTPFRGDKIVTCQT